MDASGSVSVIVLALAPLGLFWLSWWLNKWPVFGYERIIKLIARDDRFAIKQFAANGPLVSAVGKYISFDANVQLVFQTLIVGVISLLLAQYQCTKSLTTVRPIYIVGLLIVLVFLIIFLLQLARGNVEPAEEGAGKRYLLGAHVVGVGVALIGSVQFLFPRLCPE